MTLDALFQNSPQWMTNAGPHGDIVLTSRIRFARNLEKQPFPGWAGKDACMLVLAELQPKVEALPEMEVAFSGHLATLEPLDKQILVEKHLVSKEHVARNEGGAVVINAPQTLSIMINEEDHLRMQSILPGLNLRQALQTLDRVDSELESLVSYAFDAELGYLTCCPTNLGTGMRASAMLHLPALVTNEQISKVVHSINRLGLTVRGLYGEGSENLGHLYQISNQQTLGEREADIVTKLERVIEQVVTHERNARQKMLEDKPLQLTNAISRAYGCLRYSRLMESKEAHNHLSMIRMGADLGIFPTQSSTFLDDLVLRIQPAHLQKQCGRPLGPEERDAYRAQFLREMISGLPDPIHI